MMGIKIVVQMTMISSSVNSEPILSVTGIIELLVKFLDNIELILASGQRDAGTHQ